MDCVVAPSNRLTPTVITDIPGDKSISHRAIILGSLADNPSVFTHFLTAEDCLNTVSIFRALGVSIERFEDRVTVNGVGIQGLQPPSQLLDTGNSGTGIRLITGVLAGQLFSTTLSGDASIQRRPMKRVVDPLTQMGAHITGHAIAGKSDIYPPLTVHGGHPLSGIVYSLPVASAQVKSAVLLAGLFATGSTTVIEPERCRDHTERMMAGYGLEIKRDNHTIELTPGRLRNPNPKVPIRIPSDFSSAAFFLVLGAVTCPVTLTGIGLNDTRRTLLDVLVRMGAKVTITDRSGDDFEPHATIHVEPSPLRNVTIEGPDIPFLIDEIPILAIAALFASGTLVVRDAAELRVKESDRIAAIVASVRAMGASIIEKDDGFELFGTISVDGFVVESQGDHRIAMSAIIGAIAAGKSARVLGCDCIRTSFPNFFDILSRIGAEFSLVSA